MILAVDQGTTGTRSMIVDGEGSPLAVAYRRHRQITPRPGWVEHDPEEIWRYVATTARAAMRKAGVGPRDIAAIGIANQGETVVAWDAQTGRPLANAIVWQCARTRRSMERLARDRPTARWIRHLTGLVPDCYFSASKLRWLWDHVPQCRTLARQGRLRMGTLDTWLIYKWSRGRDFVTDCTTASRTLLMDLAKRQWSAELLRLFRLSGEWLAPIVDAAGPIGTAVLEGCEVPILASAVDQQAALFGQCCFQAGQAKCTFGTGAFLLMHTGAAPVISRHGLLATVAFARRGQPTYALDGGVYVAGAAVEWLRRVGLAADGADAARLAASVPDSGGIVFIPALAGLAAPYWSRTARGMVLGLSTASTRAHVIRAMFEGIALRVFTVAELMARESGCALRPALRADGGLSQNDFLMQFLADMLQAPVEVPACHEMTALGVAYMAGLEAGVFPSQAHLEKLWRCARRFEPRMSDAERREHIARHRRAIRSLLAWRSE